MTSRLSFLLCFLISLTLAGCSRVELNCGCDCCKGKEVCCCNEDKAASPAATPGAVEGKRHPLKGVVVNRLPERGALMVKHEAIPGVMGAMTMLFKVDAATLDRVKNGDAITATMLKRGDDWVLEDVKPR